VAREKKVDTTGGTGIRAEGSTFTADHPRVGRTLAVKETWGKKS
jgi:hypothetical protein